MLRCSNCTIFSYRLQPSLLLVCNLLTVCGSVVFVIQFLVTEVYHTDVAQAFECQVYF
jgi:hypothetical protein